MGRKKYWIIRLFFALFTMSVSVAILPCGIINVHGLFGEVTAHVIVEDKEQEIIYSRIFSKCEGYFNGTGNGAG